MMRSLPALFLCVIITLAVTSCGHGERDYTRWESIQQEGWAYGDTIFLLPVDTALPDNDTLVRRRLHIGLTHDNDYPYSNVWLEITCKGADKRYRYTVNIPLADVYGRWLGSGFGGEYQREVVITPAAEIDLTVPVEVRHKMRLDTLRGIDKIGILAD